MKEVIQKVSDEEADAFCRDSIVVRCKDCRYFEHLRNTDLTKCRKLKMYGLFYPSGYCCLGKLKQ